MRLTRKALAALAITPLLLGGLGVLPAQAGEQAASESEQAVEVLERVVPDIMEATAVNPGVTISPEGTVNVGDDSQNPDVDSSTTSFTVDYAHSRIGGADGTTVFDSDQEGVKAVVQPNATGVRILTTIADESAPSSYSYTFDVPSDTTLVQTEGGYSMRSSQDILGTLLEPWAVDANGKNIPTSYTWTQGKLTQHVDLTVPGITFPVIADPAWGYSYKFSTTKTATKNKSLLHNCFNCYFPVKGAPRNFPKPNQLLPLRVGPANFECRFKREMSSANYFGFQFDATKNHVDGAGSNIIFQFRTISGKKYLTVEAYIVNDAFWVKNALYRSGAIQTWSDFAKNLNKA